jgi:predicted phage-related endonuclease
MSVEAILISDRDEWLALRKYDVTASTVSVAEGTNPYQSPLRLYLEKRGIEFPELKDNLMLRRGRRFEPAVAASVEEDRPGWKLEKAKHYYRDSTIGIGATPDFYINGDPRGLGTLQTKTVNPWVFERDWTEAPPAYVVVQARTEAMLVDARFAAVAAMVMIEPEFPVHIYEFARDPVEEQRIRQVVIDFWQMVEDGRQPDVNYSLDRELLAALSPKESADKQIDLSADNAVMSGVLERAELRARIKAEEDRCSEIETMIMSKMEDAAIAKVPGFNVTWKMQHRKGYSVPAKDKRVLLIREKK